MPKSFLGKPVEVLFEVGLSIKFRVGQFEPDICFSYDLAGVVRKGVRQRPHFSRTFAPCFASAGDGQPVKVRTTGGW